MILEYQELTETDPNLLGIGEETADPFWRAAGDKQHVAFVDPQGIRNLPLDDPKIKFYETVKEIEKRLDDPKVVLDSFIVSNTPSHTMNLFWKIDKPAMQSRHILFQEEDSDSYVGEMLNMLTR